MLKSDLIKFRIQGVVISISRLNFVSELYIRLDLILLQVNSWINYLGTSLQTPTFFQVYFHYFFI